MKTLYCLGVSPQFRVPCIKYSFIMKENENKIRNYLPKGNHIIKDFYNFEKKQNEKLVDQWIDQLYPVRAIKRCFEINPSIKQGMRIFYRHLRESLSDGKSKTFDKINKNENNILENNINILNDNNKIKNLKYIFDSNNFNRKESINKENKKNNFYIKNEDNKIQIQEIQSKNISNNTQTSLVRKLYNYNYPIVNELYTLDLCHSLISKNKTKRNTQLLSTSNNNNISLSNNSNSRIILNSQFLNNFDSKNITTNSKSEIKKSKNITKEINNKLIIKMYKTKNKKFKSSNSIDNLIKRKTKSRKETQQNKLNIIYSENEEQFYRKYDKYRKNKFLNGLCLTHINSSPKVILNQLNEKINLIKNKVGVVKSIVDKTFPKVLADISLTKKEYKNSQGKEGYNSPYKEKLNTIKKHQKYMDLYFSRPFKIISRNSKDISK